jgi:phosphonate transport system substrate-binding protein
MSARSGNGDRPALGGTISFRPLVKLLLYACLLLSGFSARAEEERLSFGVITQRSPVLTAQYWNPILHYITRRSGIPLQLKLAKTGPEHAKMIGRGEFDFIFSNHNFAQENDKVGYVVFARTVEPDIQGQIVVLSDSPIDSLAELHGKEVAFPSMMAFVGYYVPQDTLLRAGIHVKPLFAGKQESAFAQLVSGRAVAAAVNSEVVKDYAARQNVGFKVLWSSEKYLNMPISAHPSLRPAQISAVRDAFVNMANDPEGAKVLAESAKLIQQKSPYGFVPAKDSDFDRVRRFYRDSLVKSETP